MRITTSNPKKPTGTSSVTFVSCSGSATYKLELKATNVKRVVSRDDELLKEIEEIASIVNTSGVTCPMLRIFLDCKARIDTRRYFKNMGLSAWETAKSRGN